jgi:hypothetical protein
MKVTVFWVVMPCSVVDKYQHFGGTCYHHSSTLKMEEIDSFKVLVHTTRLHGVKYQETSTSYSLLSEPQLSSGVF